MGPARRPAGGGCDEAGIVQANVDLYGSMAKAWAGIGAPKSRYTRQWNEWTQEDDDYLLEHAGASEDAEAVMTCPRCLGRGTTHEWWHASRVSTRKTRCWLCGGSGLAEIGAGDA